MIDMHTHILPGVDDGPSDMGESLGILEKGIGAGIKTFALTPHIRDDSDWNKIGMIKEVFSRLKMRCAARGIDVKLILGAELLLTPSLPDRIMDNTSVIINGKRKYVLVELPFYQMPIYIEDTLFKLLMLRVIPVIAHPERCLYLNVKGDVLKKWMDNGIMIQVNTKSLNGQYGIKIKMFANKLLKNRLVNFLGSDVHSIDDDFSAFSRAIKLASKAGIKEEI